MVVQFEDASSVSSPSGKRTGATPSSSGMGHGELSGNDFRSSARAGRKIKVLRCRLFGMLIIPFIAIAILSALILPSAVSDERSTSVAESAVIISDHISHLVLLYAAEAEVTATVLLLFNGYPVMDSPTGERSHIDFASALTALLNLRRKVDAHLIELLEALDGAESVWSARSTASAAGRVYDYSQDHLAELRYLVDGWIGVEYVAQFAKTLAANAPVPSPFGEWADDHHHRRRRAAAQAGGFADERPLADASLGMGGPDARRSTHPTSLLGRAPIKSDGRTAIASTDPSFNLLIAALMKSVDDRGHLGVATAEHVFGPLGGRGEGLFCSESGCQSACSGRESGDESKGRTGVGLASFNVSAKTTDVTRDSEGLRTRDRRGGRGRRAHHVADGDDVVSEMIEGYYSLVDDLLDMLGSLVHLAGNEEAALQFVSALFTATITRTTNAMALTGWVALSRGGFHSISEVERFLRTGGRFDGAADALMHIAQRNETAVSMLRGRNIYDLRMFVGSMRGTLLIEGHNIVNASVRANTSPSAPDATNHGAHDSHATPAATPVPSPGASGGGHHNSNHGLGTPTPHPVHGSVTPTPMRTVTPVAHHMHTSVTPTNQMMLKTITPEPRGRTVHGALLRGRGAEVAAPAVGLGGSSLTATASGHDAQATHDASSAPPVSGTYGALGIDRVLYDAQHAARLRVLIDAVTAELSVVMTSYFGTALNSITDLHAVSVRMLVLQAVAVVCAVATTIILGLLFSQQIARPFLRQQQMKRALKAKVVAMVEHEESLSRFVSSGLVHLLRKRNFGEVLLGDHVLISLTIMFSDVWHFTTLSERFSPMETFQLVNSFYSRTADHYQAAGGMIDKYLGDGVLSLFTDVGAAINVANALHDESEQVSREYRVERRCGFPFQVGVGIHSGDVVLGTVGSSERMDVTIISDAANTASRVESYTRQYDAPTLITEASRQRLSADDHMTRFVGNVYPKGKQVCVMLYEPISADTDVAEAKREHLPLWVQAVDASACGPVEECVRLFEHYIAICPQDKVAAKKFMLLSSKFAASNAAHDATGQQPFPTAAHPRATAGVSIPSSGFGSVDNRGDRSLGGSAVALKSGMPAVSSPSVLDPATTSIQMFGSADFDERAHVAPPFTPSAHRAFGASSASIPNAAASLPSMSGSVPRSPVQHAGVSPVRSPDNSTFQLAAGGIPVLPAMTATPATPQRNFGVSQRFAAPSASGSEIAQRNPSVAFAMDKSPYSSPIIPAAQGADHRAEGAEGNVGGGTGVEESWSATAAVDAFSDGSRRRSAGGTVVRASSISEVYDGEKGGPYHRLKEVRDEDGTTRAVESLTDAKALSRDAKVRAWNGSQAPDSPMSSYAAGDNGTPGHPLVVSSTGADSSFATAHGEGRQGRALGPSPLGRPAPTRASDASVGGGGRSRQGSSVPPAEVAQMPGVGGTQPPHYLSSLTGSVVRKSSIAAGVSSGSLQLGLSPSDPSPNKRSSSQATGEYLQSDVVTHGDPTRSFLSQFSSANNTVNGDSVVATALAVVSGPRSAGGSVVGNGAATVHVLPADVPPGLAALMQQHSALSSSHRGAGAVPPVLALPPDAAIASSSYGHVSPRERSGSNSPEEPVRESESAGVLTSYCRSGSGLQTPTRPRVAMSASGVATDSLGSSHRRLSSAGPRESRAVDVVYASPSLSP